MLKKTDWRLLGIGNGRVLGRDKENKMRKFLSLFLCCLTVLILTFVSCKEDTDRNGLSQPFVKDLEMVVYAVKDEAKDVTQSRGLLSYADFDLKYDPDHIFLHVIGSDATVKIPLSSKKLCDYVNSEGKTEERECKCFSYRVERLEDGRTIVTPILTDGSLSTESLTIPADNKGCYFSSVEESVFELPSENITPIHKTIDGKEVNYAIFERDGVNKEVYRSAENFSVDDLADGLDLLIVHRACAGFNVLGLFYDGQEYIESEEPTFVEFDEDEFEEIMGSSYESWYIKIYIGGSTFTDKYDYGTMQACGDYSKGYYSTGDFQQFDSKNFGYNLYYLQSYGYYTPKKRQLFTPALGETVDVYILIKHWGDEEGEEGDEPSDAWLASDDDALYTRMNITGGIQPINNCFYILGLLMDIRQFKIAWDNAMETKQNEASTISRSVNGMQYFSLENTKVICEQY